MKKKLMIVVANLQGGGQERIAALTSIILEDDYDISFVVFDDSDSKYLVSDKADFINLNIPPATNVIGRIWNVISRSIVLSKIKRKKRVDYCLSIGRTANIANCLIRSKSKTIVSIRNSSKIETAKRNLINSIIYNKSDGVVCISEGQRHRILNYYPEIEKKTFVLYNPCDLDRIKKYRKKQNRLSDKRIIVACGRLEGMKCYKNLFNAVRIVYEEMNEIELIVIGEGKQRKELEEYIEKNDMGSYITLLGFRDEPYKYVAESDVFAFSSAREGFPNVLVEGLACGVPVVSTDCEYGPREILTGKFSEDKLNNYVVTEYGILTPAFVEGMDNQVKIEKVFANALVDVLKNDSLKRSLSQKGIERAEDFSSNSFCVRIKKILNTIGA